jgi:dihydropyrimidinase
LSCSAIYLGGDTIKTLIKNGVIVNYDGRMKKDILIEAGIIKAIGEDLSDEESEIIDAAGRFIFPGFIDAHTHPGLPEDLGYFKESNDFYTETFAARVGGTTTIIDFAEQQKGERLIDALYKRRKRYDGLANCRYGFHLAVTEVQEDIYEQLKEIKNAGVKSIKLYTTYNMKLKHEDILKVMDCCSKLDMVVLIHCEEDSIINYCSKNDFYEQSRPREAEYNMVHTIITFAKLTGCRAYICHVSCKDSVELIREAKQNGIKVYLETCPQYLIFDSSVYNLEPEEMTKYILSPPFREAADREALINACLDGTVDLISTDHCAFLFEEHKAKYCGNLSKAAKGMPGIQLRPSLVYDILVKKRGLRVESFVRLLSFNAAKILGLGDRGFLKEGMLGDLIIWNEEEFRVSMNIMVEGTDYSPYENLILAGKPQRVVST